MTYALGIDFGTESARASSSTARTGASSARASSRTRTASSTSGCRRRTRTSSSSRTGRSRIRATTSARSRSRCRASSPRPASSPADVIGIGIDFTSCTMLPTLADGTPLCLLDDLRREPHAWVKLWKHHAAQPEADRINAVGGRARRAVASPLRRQDLLRVVLREGAADPRRGARRLRAAPTG